MNFISIKGQEAPEKPKISHFSWQLAEMTDRHNAIRDSGTTCTDNLRNILRESDPDHSKALARLKKTFA